MEALLPNHGVSGRRKGDAAEIVDAIEGRKNLTHRRRCASRTGYEQQGRSESPGGKEQTMQS
jgi:hypothetical protein